MEYGVQRKLSARVTVDLFDLFADAFTVAAPLKEANSWRNEVNMWANGRRDNVFVTANLTLTGIAVLEIVVLSLQKCFHLGDCCLNPDPTTLGGERLPVGSDSSFAEPSAYRLNGLV